MNKFKAVASLIAILVFGSQTMRHAFVLWVERNESVLDKFDETKQKIAATQSIEELLKLYEPAQQKVKEANEKQKADKEEQDEYRNWEKEPYKSERELKSEIETREDHARQLIRLHFFWWCGFGTLILGVFATVRHRPWLGVSLFFLGYVVMSWYTCPSYRTLGFPVEFKQLLTYKLIYSAASLLLLLVGWRIIESPAKDGGGPSGA